MPVVRVICIYLTLSPKPPNLVMKVSSRIKFWVWYTHRAPSFDGSLKSTTASPRAVPTSALESRVQLPALAGAEFALVDCGITVAGWDCGAAAGALEFAFAAGACPHAASRLAPTRINTNKY